MSDMPGTISREAASQAGAVYATLRARAIALVQAMAGDVWTDYNFSDPGVTVLEQLCYALTELPYRAGFHVAELLAPREGGRLPLRRHGLYPVWSILPCDPVTADDLRRSMLDRVPGVANVWFTPLLAKAAPAGISGLYDVAILAHPEHTAHEGGHQRLIRRLRRCYAGYRSLCEDLHRVRVLAAVPTHVHASVMLAEGVDATDTLAHALFALGLFLAPEPKRQSLDERLADGASTTEVFSGPLMLRGFIADGQLSHLPTRFEVNALIQVLAQVPGVLAVDRMAVEVRGHPVRYEPGDTIDVPEHGVLQLQAASDSGHATLHLFCNHLRCGIDMPRMRRRLALLWRQQRQTHRLRTEYARRYAPPAAPYRDLSTYTSLQNQFPQVYGIGQAGLPADASAMRRAQARQLQGYLMPFDQLLADYFSQVAFLPKLFSLQAGGRATYASQSLRHGVPGAEALLGPDYVPGLNALTAMADPVEQRRNAVLDFLLSCYALRLTSLAGGDANMDNAHVGTADVRAKQDLLRHAARITRARGKGLDVRRAGSVRGMTGVERASRIAMGLLDADLADEATHVSMDGSHHGMAAVVHDPAEASFGRLQRPHLWPVIADPGGAVEAHLAFEHGDEASSGRSPLAGHRVAASLLHCLGDPSRYRLRAMDNSEAFHLACCDALGGWWMIGLYETQEQAIAKLRDLLWVMGWRPRRHRPRHLLYIVEWLLLRPVDLVHAPAPLVQADRHSLRISAVLSAHDDAADTPGWRLHAEAIVRENTPAHIALECVFLSCEEMRHFEPLYALWMRGLREGPLALRAEAGEHLLHFLTRHATPQPGAPREDAFAAAPSARPSEPATQLAGLVTDELLTALLDRLPKHPVHAPAHRPAPVPVPTPSAPGVHTSPTPSPMPLPVPAAPEPVVLSHRSSRFDAASASLKKLWALLQSVWRRLRGLLPARDGQTGGVVPVAPVPSSAPRPPPDVSPAQVGPAAQPALPGALGFDTDTALTPATARAFAEAGFHFAVRYLSRHPSGQAGDLTAAETREILSAGLALMAVQHAPPPGWMPDAALGARQGQAAGHNARAAGLPAGISIWLDLENVAAGTAAVQVIAYCNAWFAEVIAAGYTVGVYLGADCGLSAEQLGRDLQCSRFWKSSSSVSDVMGCNYCMVQTSAAGDVRGGLPFDRNTVQLDGHRHPPVWLAPPGHSASSPHAHSPSQREHP